MGRRGAEHLHQMRAIGVQRACHERCFGPEGQRDRIERVVNRADRGRLRHRPDVRGGRVLAFGEPVDLVIEEQNREVDVASHRVDEVVTADAERVTIASHDPYGQVTARSR